MVAFPLLHEGGVDCGGGKSCPLYQYMPYRIKSKEVTKRKVHPNAMAGLKRYQESRKSATFDLANKENISPESGRIEISKEVSHVVG